jgi:hypothetical protein
MATTTPNFGWAVPTSTDLVKDGAVAIETLGDSIDASLVDLKGGTTNQVLAKNSNTDMDFKWVSDATGMTNPMTTTGDTIYSSSGSTPARLGIGSTGQVLTVAAGVPSWATPSAGGGGGMTLLASGTLSGASLDLTSISGSYQDLRLVVRNLLPATDATKLRLRFNNDSTANRYQWNSVASGIAFDVSYIELQSYTIDNATSQGINIIDIPDYANSTTWKFCVSNNFNNNSTTSTNVNIDSLYKGIYNQTPAITQLNLFMSSGNFTSGNYYLYGIK